MCVWVFLKPRRGVVVVRNEIYSFRRNTVGEEEGGDRLIGGPRGDRDPETAEES